MRAPVIEQDAEGVTIHANSGWGRVFPRVVRCTAGGIVRWYGRSDRRFFARDVARSRLAELRAERPRLAGEWWAVWVDRTGAPWWGQPRKVWLCSVHQDELVATLKTLSKVLNMPVPDGPWKGGGNWKR